MANFPEQYNIEILDKDTFQQQGDLGVSFENWRAQVLAAMQKIASTKAGAALLTAIQSKKRWVQITTPSDPGACKSSAIPTGQPRQQPGNTRDYMSLVEFSPQMFMLGSECYIAKRLWDPNFNRGALPDEILFHELVHTCIRGSDASSAPSLGGGLIRYGDEQEFFAVLLTNIYISDASNHSKSGLRADHALKRPLEKELSTSFSFYKSSPRVLKLMNGLVNKQPALCHALAHIKADFNPLAAYFQNYHAIKSLSQSPLAISREHTIPRLPKPKLPSPTLAETLAYEAVAILKRL